jgi:hypothetical protein
MLTIITTTHNRPLCFAILEGWMARQSLQPDQWLVVNDGAEPYTYSRGQEVITRKPKKTMKTLDGKTVPEMSILANWLAALPKIKGDRVAVVEDDDWLHPDYLKTMVGLLDEVDVAGVSGDLYYKLPIKKFIRMHNMNHASLGATVFRSSALPAVERACRLLCPNNNSPFIDMYLWAEAEPIHGLKTRLVGNRAPDGRAWHVGMKLMPGAAGLGIGHGHDGSTDPTFAVLRQWVGADACRVFQGVRHG